MEEKMEKCTHLPTYQALLQWPRQLHSKENIQYIKITPDQVDINYNWVQLPELYTINPLCRLCGEENETFWHFVTECLKISTYRNDTLLDNPPQQDNWKLKQIMQFSTYPAIYNLMSYDQEYNE